MITAAIIAAAGKGLRMGGNTPKQFLVLEGKTIIAHTIGIFEQCTEVDLIYPVLPPESVPHFYDTICPHDTFRKIAQIIPGGQQRQDSVKNALNFIDPHVDVILVHDGVRPFVSQRLLHNCIHSAAEFGASLAAFPVNETVKQVDEHGWVNRTLSRDTIYTAQTPQAFRRDILLRAFRKAEEKGLYSTDETSLVENLGVKVKVILGEKWNLKITNPEDLAWASMIYTQLKRGKQL